MGRQTSVVHAAAAVLVPALAPGVVVVPGDGYPGVTLVWVETPSDPGLAVLDVAALAGAAPTG